MSLPSFPVNENVPSREEVMNQIISSIAMEELGLSHIINAEGEKIQYALGTIPGVSGPEEPITMDQLLELNKSVRSTLDSTMMNQFFLKEKLTNALTAATMQGPTGPQGPQGPATIEVSPDVLALEPEVPPTVANLGDEENVLLQFGLPRGATGASGSTGTTGATPTVEIGTTETVEPESAATVTATPTATGVELDFQIPRGATGTVEAEGIQVILNNPDGLERDIAEGAVIPFDEVVSNSGTNITYTPATGIFSITPTEQNNMFFITWWVSSSGSETSNFVALSVNVNGESYVTSTPYVESQLTGSTLFVVGAGVTSVQVSLTNVTGNAISFSPAIIQAQMSIIGFNRV